MKSTNLSKDDLIEALADFRIKLNQDFATKADLENLVSKEDLETLANKEDLMQSEERQKAYTEEVGQHIVAAFDETHSQHLIKFHTKTNSSTI